jgi:hypothetical protein
MKRAIQILGWVACALALGACDGSDGPPSRLTLKQGQTLDGPACGVENNACPTSLSCASVDLDTGSRTLCVNTQDICERLSCLAGECAILESFPAQIRCVN